MVIEFEPVGHIYRLNGEVVPSVTQVLGPLQTFSGIPSAMLEAARLFGSHVHEACDLLNRGELEWASLDTALVPYIEGYQKFIDESGAVVTGSELVVASEKYRYAGKLDDEMIIRDCPAIVDIKSGVVPKTVGPQTAAYERARFETRGSAAKRFCLQLMPGAYKLHRLNNLADFSMFLSALNVWRYLNA